MYTLEKSFGCPNQIILVEKFGCSNWLIESAWSVFHVCSRSTKFIIVPKKFESQVLQFNIIFDYNQTRKAERCYNAYYAFRHTWRTIIDSLQHKIGKNASYLQGFLIILFTHLCRR
jgi:hypothetical protein